MESKSRSYVTRACNGAVTRISPAVIEAPKNETSRVVRSIIN